MPQSSVYALLGLLSFVLALWVARLVVRIQRGELPGGDLWVLYLRILLGFLFAAAIVYGYRSFFP
ncbi:MAG: flagellar biosynthesis protein FliR [Fretibacterium sp.]|nr:flagellar biosynthesis protein FliR [Fretibacterium sp.]